MTEIKFKKLTEDAIPFAYSRELDACMDMFSNEEKVIIPGDTNIIHTGIAVEIPNSYFGMVKGRSGLSSKGILVATGTIDETYRGDIGIIVTNTTNDYFIVHKGTKLAQFSIHPVIRMKLVESNILSSTERNTNGFGSSGM